MINCPICNKEMNYINNSHLKVHNLTPLKFKELYPDFNNISDSARKLMGGDKTNAVIANKKKANEDREIKKNEYKLLNKCCPNCSEPISFENKNNKFCSSSCAATYTNKNRTVVYSAEGYKSLQEAGKRSITNFLNCKRVKLIPQIYTLNCIICKIDFYKGSNGKNHKTCSKKCRDINHSLNNFKQTKTFGKCGYYQGTYCASSWELAFLIFNKDLGNDIKRCELNFTYFMDDKQHLYFPDFIMNDIIYEVKGYEKEDVKLKTEAVVVAGYKIEVIRKKEILPIIKEIKSKYNVKHIVELYDKVNV